MELFDLTRPIHPGMPLHPGDPPVTLTAVRTHMTDGYEVTEVCLGSHTGTHLDAPRHFFPDGATLDKYPVERFIGPGLLVDCSTEMDRVIDASLLADALRPFHVPPGGFLLLRTGGCMLTADAAELLLECGAGVVGVDSASPDAEPYPVHRLLLRREVLILENLCGLDRLEPGPLTCACLPLALTGADAAPVRVVAWR
jgi:kynurenine formamidase